MATYLVSISSQAVDLDHIEQSRVVVVIAADPASALRKAERTLRGGARSAELRCLGPVHLPGAFDRRVFTRRAADCH